MEMNDNHKKAKLDVLKALRQVAMDLIKEKSEEGEGEEGEMSEMPEHMQKVSVMAKDPKDLLKGLDVAKKVTSGMPEVAESEDEANEDPSQQALEDLTGTEIPGGSEEDEEALLMKKLEELRNKKKMLA